MATKIKKKCVRSKAKGKKGQGNKGQFLAIGTVVKILLILVVLVVGVSIVSSEKGIVQDITDWFMRILADLGLVALSQNDKIAMASTQALSCAVDVVAWYTDEYKTGKTLTNTEVVALFGKIESCKGERYLAIQGDSMFGGSGGDGTSTFESIMPTISSDPPEKDPPPEDDPPTPPTTGSSWSLIYDKETKFTCEGDTYTLKLTDLAKNNELAELTLSKGASSQAKWIDKGDTEKFSGGVRVKVSSVNYNVATPENSKASGKIACGGTGELAGFESAENNLNDNGITGLATGNQITGNLMADSLKNQCGVPECGHVDKDACGIDQRCVSKNLGWYCVDDDTCVDDVSEQRCFGPNGDICVYCVGEGDNFFCNVVNFELPQEIKESKWWSPKSWINSAGDPRYLVFYESFPDDESVGWAFESPDRYAVAFIVAGGVLNAVPMGKNALLATKAGKMAASGTNRLMGSAYREMGERLLKEVGGESLEKASVGFLRRLTGKYMVRKAVSHGAYNKEIIATATVKIMDDAGISIGEQKTAKELAEELMELQNRGITSKLEKEATKMHTDMIKIEYGLTDEGIERAEKIVTEEAIKKAGGLSFAQKAKAGLKSSINNMLEGTGSAAKARAAEKGLAVEGMEDFGFLGKKYYVLTLHSERMVKTPALVDDMNANQGYILESLIKKGEKTKALGLVDDIFTKLDDKIGIAATKGDKSILDKVADNTITSDGLHSQIDDISSELYPKYAKDFGMEGKEQEFKKLVNKMVEDSVVVDHKVSRGIVKESLDSTIALFTKGEFSEMITSGHSIRQGMPDAMRRQLDKRIADAIRGETDHTLAKGVMNSKAFWMVSTDMVADVFPAEIEMGDNSKVSTTGLFADGTKLVAGCQNFRKMCVFAFAVGYTALLAESVSEPRMDGAAGLNGMGLKIPYESLDQDKYKIDLDKEHTFKYYLHNDRTGLSTNPKPRLHFASPCKATLTVKKEEPIRCYFTKCYVSDDLKDGFEEECGGKGKCYTDKIDEYKADNCGYTVVDDKILWVDIEYGMETANKFYVFGSSTDWSGMNAIEAVIDRSVFDMDGLPENNRVGTLDVEKNIYLTNTEYLDPKIISHDPSIARPLDSNDIRGTKICPSYSATDFISSAIVEKADNLVHLDSQFMTAQSYTYPYTISVKTTREDYGSNANYCLQTENKAAAWGRVVNLAGWTIIDIGITSIRFSSPQGFVIGTAASFVTGAGSVAADQWLEDKTLLNWPGEEI